MLPFPLGDVMGMASHFRFKQLILLLGFAALFTACEQKFGIQLTPKQKVSEVQILKESSSLPEPGASNTPVIDPVQPGVQKKSAVEKFSVQQVSIVEKEIAPKIHILFVIDNSPSMEAHQAKLVAGFEDFSKGFFNAKIDLSVATITTDTYLAGSGNPNLGPLKGNCYGLLLPGIHDGSRGSHLNFLLGTEFLPNSCELTSASRAALQASGTRSLRPILSTVPSDGSKPDDHYFQSMQAAFRLNAQPGVNGASDERGFQSIHKFLSANEERSECTQKVVTDPSCFFPHYDSTQVEVQPINIVVVLSDEHDTSKTDFGLVGQTVIDHSMQTVRLMTSDEMLKSSYILATAMKKRLDQFFLKLQQPGATNPNYQFFAISHKNCTDYMASYCGVEYEALVDLYAGNDGSQGRLKRTGDRNNSGAKYSKTFDISETRYSEFFNHIGTRIVTETKVIPFTSFTLSKKPSTLEDISAELVLGNGNRIPISKDWISIDAAKKDQININNDANQLMNVIPSGDTRATISIQYSYQ